MRVNGNEVNNGSEDNTIKKVNNINKFKTLHRQLCITHANPVLYTYSIYFHNSYSVSYYVKVDVC